MFVLSLAFCAYSYLVLWSALRGSFVYAACVFDAVLVSVFAAHHSVFARDRVKRWLAGTLPERLLRSVYVWTASVLLIIVCGLWQPIGGSLYRATGRPAIAHAAIQLIGVWFIAWSVSVIDALELAGIRRSQQVRLKPDTTDGVDAEVRLTASAKVMAVRRSSTRRRKADVTAIVSHALKPDATNGSAADRFQVTGPYRLVRHPLYLGWILAVFGPAHMTGDRLAFAAITTIYLMIAIPLEERSLVGAFGDEYERYTQQVKWRVVPYIY